MKEARGDLWTLRGDAKCILTNGMIKKNGRAVMGVGVAHQAAERYPGLDLVLARKLKLGGNSVHHIWTDYNDGTLLYSFPTKHHWNDQSDLKLIEQSAHELMERLRDQVHLVLLPRPGCGHGGLDYHNEVRPIIEPILDDRVIVITNQ